MQQRELKADRAGERLDVLVARRFADLSRSYVQSLIQEGFVTVDMLAVKPSHRLAGGEDIVVMIPPKAPSELLAEDIPLTVVYQDHDILVIDKPPDLTVHPAPGHPSGTLVNALLSICPELRELRNTLRPGIVHRLDKDTSGLMIVAKNERARLNLIQQLKDREVRKVYLTLVEGQPKPPQGMIEAPIGRHPRDRKKMAIIEGGRDAQTRYRTREVLGRYALLEAEPVTGRTHQIRVHLAALGHPVAGDATYGRKSDLVSRQFLHAHKLAFRLPTSQREIEFESPFPADLRQALETLRRDARR